MTAPDPELARLRASIDNIDAALVHLLANVGPAERADVEGVHQVRVAVRRLRAALALFKPHLPPVTLGRFNDELRRLGGIFGRARDWDVFVCETLSIAEKDMPEPGRLGGRSPTIAARAGFKACSDG